MSPCPPETACAPGSLRTPRGPSPCPWARAMGFSARAMGFALLVFGALLIPQGGLTRHVVLDRVRTSFQEARAARQTLRLPQRPSCGPSGPPCGPRIGEPAASSRATPRRPFTRGAFAPGAKPDTSVTYGSSTARGLPVDSASTPFHFEGEEPAHPRRRTIAIVSASGEVQVNASPPGIRPWGGASRDPAMAHREVRSRPLASERLSPRLTQDLRRSNPSSPPKRKDEDDEEELFSSSRMGLKTKAHAARGSLEAAWRLGFLLGRRRASPLDFDPSQARALLQRVALEHQTQT